MPLPIDIQREIVSRAQAGESAGALMDEYDLSRHQYYSTLAANGWKSGRKQRYDRGARKWPEELVEYLARRLLVTKRKDRHMIGTIKVEMDIMQANGIISQDQVVSPGTAARWLREAKLSKRQMMGELDGRSVHNAMRSKYGNHVHQFDISICTQYYFGDRGIRDSNVIEMYKIENMKAEVARKNKILRYVITDHYSNAFYVRYYYSPGENTADVIDFLWRSWSLKDADNYPFCGTPEILYMDQGPANKAGVVKQLLRNLGIDYRYHDPGNARATGSVEGMQGFWERNFESRLATEPAKDIDDLNHKAGLACIGINGNAGYRVRRHGQTRSRFWFEHHQTPLRLVPEWEIFSQFAMTEPEKRIVKANGVVLYSTKYGQYSEFRLIGRDGIVPADLKGETVHVQYSPYEYPMLEVIWKLGTAEEKRFRAEPVEKDVAGFALSSPVFGQADTEMVKRNRQSQTQRAMKEIAEIKVPEQIRAFDHMAEDVPDTFILQPGETVGGDHAVEMTSDKQLGIFAIKQMLNDAGLVFNFNGPEARNLVEILMAGRDFVPAAEVDKFIQAEKQTRFKKGQGGQ